MEADQATWWETFGKLQRIMRKAAQVLFIAKKLDREQMHNYFMSGTEYNPYFFLANVPTSAGYFVFKSYNYSQTWLKGHLF